MILVEHADMLEAIPRLVAEGVQVDAICTDPPYGLEFMGKDWDKLDGGLPQEMVWKGRRGNGGSQIGNDDATPASRHHVGFGGGRSAFKRCTICGKRAFSGSPCKCAEPAWIVEYPDGPPSSAVRMQRWHEQWGRAALSILRPGGFLLAFGGTRTYHRMVCGLEDAGFVIQDTVAWLYGSGFPKSKAHLKPAHEPICLAYKPGGKRTMQVDECRIATNGEDMSRASGFAQAFEHSGWDRPGHTLEKRAARMARALSAATQLGRWPANVCHDGSDEVMAAFDVAGERPSGQPLNRLHTDPGRMVASGAGINGGGTYFHSGFGDSGSAARFFFQAKAGDEDRWGSRHPTVKPVDLIAWLVALVCPPGGTFLDTFAGSGTAAVAALKTSRNAILIERDPDYVEDIRERIAFYEGEGRHSLAAKARRAPEKPLGGLFRADR